MANLHIDSIRCTGCMNCQTVCSLVHFCRQDPSLAAIRVTLDLFGGKHSHKYCRQCKDPACVSACPVQAILENSETGVPVVNSEICISCGACTEACPFHAIFQSSSAGYAIKCDLCDGKPACIEACLFNVIELRN